MTKKYKERLVDSSMMQRDLLETELKPEARAVGFCG